MDPHDTIAPFVLKTYHMVNDPSLDTFIRWGTSNNTFIVLKPQHFSQHLLPAHFKHNNFSSFVRQLNTYGFKKVDPDRWEFANQWFLRGQTHLLKNIGRKKQQINRNCVNRCDEDDDDDDGDEMVVEIEKLKREQKILEQELVEMNKRLETTERRPEQMMALLHKVAGDPQILPRMMLQVDQRSKRLLDQKRQRIFIAPTSPSLPSPSSRLKMKEEGECQIMSSPEDCYGDEVLWRSSAPATLDAPSMSRHPTAAASGGGGGSVMDESGGGFSPMPEVKLPPDYPFSLFYGGL